MTCKQIREIIPALVRQELSGYARIPILDHLQDCDECKGEYKQYLKIFYSIDLEHISRPILTVPVDSLFRTVQPQDSTPKFLPASSRKIYYLAAAIIILGMMLIGYLYDGDTAGKNYQSFSVPSGQIRNAETGSARLTLDSQIEAMLEEDRISLTFIEDRLLNMQKKGITQFQFNRGTLPVTVYESELFTSVYNKAVSVVQCLKTVQVVKKYKSYLTISELVSFLQSIEKQGA